jgi:hypothetical protein
MTDDDLKNLRILDALSHDAALDYAENGPTDPKLRASARSLHTDVHERIAAMRRAARERELAARPVFRPPPIRPSILAMARDALVARLVDLCRTEPDAFIAHRDFATMTDADLRSALEDAEIALDDARSR